MLDISIKFNSFQPPCLFSIGGLMYVCPGWIVVPKETTLKEVYERWTKYKPLDKGYSYPDKTIMEMVKSSKGDKEYKVTLIGSIWKCNCPAGEFNRSCKHTEFIKNKYNGTN